MAATVLLPATFVVLHAERLFLAVADGAQPVCGNSERDDVLLHGAGAAIAETQIVFGGAALVAVSFDGRLDLRVVLQEIRGFRERLAGVGGAARTRGGDRVGSRIRGRDLGRTLGGHSAHFRRDSELRRVSGIPTQGRRLTLID